MNYLQLTNDYLIDTGAGDPIGSVVGQSDEYLQGTTWIADAWVELQRNRNWGFRWAEGTFDTVLGQSAYALVDLSRVAGDDFDMKSFYYPVDGGGSTPLTPVEPHVLRAALSASGATQGTPRYISRYPDGSLRLYPTPDSVATIKYEYFGAPIVLVADLDTPTLDPKFHKAIVWKAVEQYAREQGKEWSALYQAAIRNFNAIYSQMLNQETGRVYRAPSPFTHR